MRKSFKNTSSKLLFSAAKSLYGLASVLIVIALVLGARIIPAGASPGELSNPAQTTFCNLGSQGTIVKVESPPWTFTASNGGIITVVGIKAGNGCPTVFRANGANACYGISGIGTRKVTVWQIADAPSTCHDISHLEIVIIDPGIPSTATLIPSATPTASSTLQSGWTTTVTQTPELTNSPTHTATPVNPTATSVGSTATPLGFTTTPADPTTTPADPTVTPAAPTATTIDPTTIPVDPTATQVDPTATQVDPTATQVDPTATQVDPTATQVDPTTTVRDPSVTPVDPTTTPLVDPTATLTEEPRRDPSPVPTLLIPPEGNDEFLIPVTGLAAPFSTADTQIKRSVYAKTSSSFSLMFFGFGLILNGAAIFKKRKEEH